MLIVSTRKAGWALAAVLLVTGLAGAYAQPSSERGEVNALVKELGLPADGAEAARKLIRVFLGEMQDSGREMLDYLEEKRPEQLLDPQVAARIGQIQKGFALKLEHFHLDLSDLAGEEKAGRVVARFRAVAPQVLLGDGTAAQPAMAHASAPGASTPPASLPPADSGGKPAEVPLGSAPIAPNLDLQLPGPAAGASGSQGGMGGMMEMMSSMMGMMGGMGGTPPAGPGAAMPGMGSAGGSSSSSMAAMPGMAAAAAPGGELSGQLLATNALLTKLLATLSAQPGGIQAAQLQTINQLLANQAALLQLLQGGGAAAPSAPAAPAAPARAGGMSGMSGM